MHFLRITLLLILIISSQGLLAQSNETQVKKTLYAQAMQSTSPPDIDGKLTDETWQQNGALGKDFIQWQPDAGKSSTEATQLMITYDKRHLYVAIQCFDQQPELINSRMSRRDGSVGDWVEIHLDTDHDQRTAFVFTLSAAGVKSDRIVSQNGAIEDLSWNPIWYAQSSRNSAGWTVEMKIPLTQLRFSKETQQTWGLQVVRRLFKKEELSVWQPVSADAPGWVSEFGELKGLDQLQQQHQLELQPYILSGLRTIEKDPDNPFKLHNQNITDIGLDGKVGLTNNLTMDFTINPDFGQVEADPAALALDGFQLFFREQRPFFVTNSDIFDYRFSAPLMGGSFSSDNLFYSRRIGRQPQGTVSAATVTYTDSPEKTRILAAVKLSGKTKKGLSIGIMESITRSEFAQLDNGQERWKSPIEPLTSYFVTRLQKDFNERNSYIGAILTSTNRQSKTNLNFLHSSAITGGLDFKHQWNNRTWYLTGSFVASQVKGATEAIIRTQRSIPHLFQRPDASHVSLDSSRTSLTGHGGDLRFGKAGSGRLRFESGITWRSPGLELNDLGFMREADDIQHYLAATYRSLKPFSIFRQASVVYQHWMVWDFGGNYNYLDWDIELNGTFHNNAFATFGFYSQPHTYSKSILQGGPRIGLADQLGAWWALGTDPRRKLSARLNGWTKTGGTDALYLMQNGLDITYQPINRFNLSLSPRYTLIKNRLQFNQNTFYQQSVRRVTSKLRQETLGMAIRFNYSVNANFSIQYYAEPYISVGKYQRFGYVVDPLALSEAEQMSFYTADQLTTQTSGQQLLVDENRDGQTDYALANPDFSFAQFRSNLVFRYEYKPGSEIFLVWAQGLSNVTSPADNLRNNFREQIFGERIQNTLLLKVTYRFFK